MLLLLSCLPSLAVSDSTANILNNNGWTGNISSCTPGVDCWAGYSGGSDVHDSGATFYWGYNNTVLSQTIAINNALSQSGIQVNGFSYKWRIKNGNANLYTSQPGIDPFTITVDVYKANGDLYRSYEYDYGYSHDWTDHYGSETFPDHFLSPSFFGNLSIEAYGDDSGYWAGYYGPEFNYASSYLVLNYSANPCYNNPLYSPSCEGYAEAYAQWLYDQNCTADPLYDSGCPGYATAYYNQQCTINPLYDAGCPGYAEAYYTYQCELDPFYDRGCDGYAEAYAKKYILIDDSTTEDSTQAISTTSETTVPITDPEEIAMPSTTGDATVDSVLKDLTDVPIQIIGMENSTVEAVADSSETMQEQETETASETDSAEEMIADVATEEENGNAESDSGDTTETNDESDGESSVASTDDTVSEDKDTSKDGSTKNEKLKKAIAKKASNLANEMANAASLEAQQAMQATVLALINFVPDFNSYSRMMNGGYLPDANGYADSNVPESRRGLRNGLAQQLLHEKMVQMQYDPK